MSFTHIATKSIPMLSSILKSVPKLSFVPTPSVPETKMGFL